MALFGRKRAQPLKCRWQDIYDKMEECVEINAPVLELTLQIENTSHRIGISSEMTRSGKYVDICYFFDNREYRSLNEMISSLNYASDMVVSVISEENVDNPRDYALLAQREIV